MTWCVIDCLGLFAGPLRFPGLCFLIGQVYSPAVIKVIKKTKLNHTCEALRTPSTVVKGRGRQIRVQLLKATAYGIASHHCVVTIPSQRFMQSIYLI